MDHGWPLPDLVNRGGWQKFEATHSYLNTGVYATVALSMIDSVKERGKKLQSDWPRGLQLPGSLRQHLPTDVDLLFHRTGEPGWGMEAALRGAGAAAPPPPRGVPRRNG